MAVKQPPEIGSMVQPVARMILGLAGRQSSQAVVALTTKQADSRAVPNGMLKRHCSANSGPKIDPQTSPSSEVAAIGHSSEERASGR